MKIFYFVLFGMLAVVAFFSIFSQNSGKRINEVSIANPMIDKEDRKILEPFFEALLVHRGLGYVLLGEKPAIRLGYVHHLSWKHPFFSLGSLHYFDKRNRYQKRAWEVWKKYSHRLSDHFLIVEEMNFSSPLCVDVSIIHHRCFCEAVDENRELFEKILKRKITGKVLYEEAKLEPLFSVLLEKNEALLGIILGYGKVNSMLFSEKKMNELGMFPKKEDEIPSIRLPVFRAKWDDPETIQLKEKYLACRKQIEKSFLGNNAFEQVLNILFDEAPIIEQTSELNSCHTLN